MDRTSFRDLVRWIHGSIGSDHRKPSTRSRDVYRGVSGSIGSDHGSRPRDPEMFTDASLDPSGAITEAVHAICRSLPRHLWIHRERSQEAVHAICRSIPRHLWIAPEASLDPSRAITGSRPRDQRGIPRHLWTASEASLDRSGSISGCLSRDRRSIPRRLWIDPDPFMETSRWIGGGRPRDQQVHHESSLDLVIRRRPPLLERGRLLARRKELYEALHPEARQHARGGHAKAAGAATEIISPAHAFATDAAAKLGKTERTVQEEIRIAKAMAPEAATILRGTGFEDEKVKLMELTRLPLYARSGGARACAHVRDVGEQPRL
jgi:hypothetical protein